MVVFVHVEESTKLLVLQSCIHCAVPSCCYFNWGLLLWLTSSAGRLTELLLNHVYLNGRWCALLLCLEQFPQNPIDLYTLMHLGGNEYCSSRHMKFQHLAARRKNSCKGRSLEAEQVKLHPSLFSDPHSTSMTCFDNYSLGLTWE